VDGGSESDSDSDIDSESDGDSDSGYRKVKVVKNESGQK
jgi:hypothetical protein